ncbi:beta-N-acetylhexosaminidase [Niabella drilacis]|uniref:beta-N-acetylhexosaminidase n=1 Tax=Niabella drilacis (strain DSM 25811 / CCM 8410 / CCUG 62505 / LMG 26954 / E90) TaxID=1285928 RepID=A0A1G6Y0B8_NIADE|nr:beta-N-acetylhexosaminidase [Niabella drilacis]SDD83393.1 hexosaminidase [Niabella drilacis]
MKGIMVCLSVGLFTGSLQAQQQPLNIIPQPASVQLKKGSVKLERDAAIYMDRNVQIDTAYWDAVLTEIGLQPRWVSTPQKARVRFALNTGANDPKDESYRLELRSGNAQSPAVSVQANGSKGLLYALQTLRQLGQEPQADGVSFPACVIADKPAFPWRAYMLDESRNFHGKEMVKRLLDEMARLKLNTFHWHLVDDPAWRIEIKKYPLLTRIGSRGNYGHMVHFQNSESRLDSLFLDPPAQFYFQKDIKEIIAYAHARGIAVIPEIEVPAHASASIFAYPWLGASSKQTGKPVHYDLYDVTDPKVEQFLHDVLDEVIALFPDGIIHIGGDEADYRHWKDSKPINDFMKAHSLPTYSDLQVWAINRMSQYIASKGYRMIGWNEITGDNIREEAHVQAGQSERLAKGTIVQFWDGNVQLVNKAIAQGYDVVNSDRHFTYLDYSYETTPLEKTYMFNPIPEGVTGADRKKILGIGCQMWGESTPTSERIYYQTFPRIAASAEVGWIPYDTKKSYGDFRKRLAPLEKIWTEKGYIQYQKGKY